MRSWTGKNAVSIPAFRRHHFTRLFRVQLPLAPMADVQAFFDATTAPADLSVKRAAIQKFVQMQMQRKRGVVLVTVSTPQNKKVS